MSSWWLRRLWPTWLTLTLLTLGSARVGSAQGLRDYAVIALFGIAALKANLVLDIFMEAPRAKRHWRWLYRLWIAAVTLVLVTGFMISTR